VRIDLDDGIIRDVEAQMRRYRLEPSETGPAGSNL
jgi:hypothetical protein